MGVCLSKDRNSDLQDHKFKKLRTEMVHEYLKCKTEFKSRQIKDDTMETSNDASFIPSPYKNTRKSNRISHRKSLGNQISNQTAGLSRHNTLPEMPRESAVLPHSEIMMGLEPIMLHNSQDVILNLMRPKSAAPINDIFLIPVHPETRTTQNIEIQTDKLEESFRVKKQTPIFSEFFKPEALIHDQSLIPDSRRPMFISVMEKNLENVDLFHERANFLDMSMTLPQPTSFPQSKNPQRSIVQVPSSKSIVQEPYKTLNCSYEAEVAKPHFKSLKEKKEENQDLMSERNKFLDMSMSAPQQLQVSYAKISEFLSQEEEEKCSDIVRLFDGSGKLIDMSLYAGDEPQEPDREKPQFMNLNQKNSLNAEQLDQRTQFLDMSMSVPAHPKILIQEIIMKDYQEQLSQRPQFLDSEPEEPDISMRDDQEQLGQKPQLLDSEPEEPEIPAKEISIKDDYYKDKYSSSSDSFSSKISQQEQPSIHQNISSKSQDFEEKHFSIHDSFSQKQEIGVFDQNEFGYMKIEKDLKAQNAEGLNLENEFSYYESFKAEEEEIPKVESPIMSKLQYEINPQPKEVLSPLGFRASAHVFRTHEKPLAPDLVRLDIMGKLTLEEEIRLSQGVRLSYSRLYAPNQYSQYGSP